MYKKISPRTKYVLQIRAIALAFAFAMIVALIFPKDSSAFLFLSAFWILALVAFISFYIPIRQNNTFFSITQNLFTLNSGVVNKITKVIYIKSIQYVAVKTSPLEKLFKVATLIIYTRGAKTLVYCVDINEAPHLAEILSNHMGCNDNQEGGDL